MSRLADKVHVKLTSVLRTAHNVIHFPGNVLSIKKIIDKPTYYPELTRKSRKEMWIDNFMWLCKYQELNKFYTSYGLDVQGFRDPDDFISHRAFCALRNKGNQQLKKTTTGDYNYIALLRDKYIFAAYLASTLGSHAVVGNRALFANKSVYLTEEQRQCSLADLLKTKQPLVFKLVDGECADGVMLIEPHPQGVVIDGKVMSLAELEDVLGANRFVIQDVIEQHPELTVFKTRSVNTIRMVTIQGKSGEINVFAAFLRLGGSAESFVDNRAKGGLGIGIELDTGKLMKYGYPHDDFGVKVEIHPWSGVRFADITLPYWKEAMELAKTAHRQFYELQSIGWDVVLTEKGPILLEGNDGWEIGGPQDTYGGLKKCWNDLVNR